MMISTERGFDKTPSLHFLAKLTIICCLMPFTFNIGSIVLSPSRVLFLLTVPYLVIRLFSGAYGKINFVDVMMFLSVIWLGLAIGYNNPESTITFVGSNAILLLGGYLTARATIRTPADLYAFGSFMIAATLLTLPLALMETMSSVAYVPHLLNSIPGIHGYADANSEPRLGLERVQVLFAHPIHYGLFCSLAFSFTFVGRQFTMPTSGRIAICMIITLCVFLSLSSAAFLTILIQGFLISWIYLFDNILKIRQGVWKVTIIIFIIFYIAVDFVSNRPAFLAIMQTLSFNSSTVYLRTQIFDYGMAQVAQTPWLGVGFNGWERPVWMSESIDNYYLFLAVIYGVPAALFFMSAAWASVFYTSNAKFEWGTQSFIVRRAWCFTVVSMLFTIATVAVWGNMLSIVYFVLGAGIWMHTYNVKDEVANPARVGRASISRKRIRRGFSGVQGAR